MPDPTKAHERYLLSKRLELLIERRDDAEALLRGAQKGIITTDEFDFAIGFHALDKPYGPQPVPATLTGSYRSPLRQVADHVRMREVLKENYDKEQEGSAVRRFVDGLAEFTTGTVRSMAEQTIGYVGLWADMTQRLTAPVENLAYSLGAPLAPWRRESAQAATQRTIERVSQTLGLGERTDEATFLQRELAGLPSGRLQQLGGDVVAIIAQILLSKTITDPRALINVQRALGGAGVLNPMLGQGRLITKPSLLETGIFSRTMGVGQGKQQLALLGAGAAAGISSMAFAAPEDRNGWNAAIRAVSGAGLFLTAGSALLGRPYGPQARAAYAQSMLLAGRNGKAAKTLLGQQATVTGLEKMGLAQVAQRWKYGVKTGMVFSPRTTFGDLLGSAAIGASTIAGKHYAEGKPADDALVLGVLEGGLWAGTDLAMARIGGVVRETAIAILQKNMIDTLIASGVDPTKAMRYGSYWSPAMQRILIGTAGGVGGAAVGVGTADEGAGLGNLALRGAVGFVGGAGLAASFTARAQAHLHSFLPRDTVGKILAGEFGQLTKSELGNAAEVMLQHSVNMTKQQLKDPIYEPLWSHVLGVQGENLVDDVWRGIAPKEAPRNVIPEFTEQTIKERVAAADALLESLRVPGGPLALGRGRRAYVGTPEGVAAPETAQVVRPAGRFSPSTASERRVAGAELETGVERAKRPALPPATGPEGILRPWPDMTGVSAGEQGQIVLERVAALRNAEKELIALRSKAKRAGKEFFQSKQLKAVRDELKEQEQIISELRARGGGIFDLPAVSSGETVTRISLIKQRQQAILSELASLEAELGPTLTPGKLKLMGEYAALRDEYAKVLELGGIQAERAVVKAGTEFAALPPSAPRTARAAAMPGSPFARLAAQINADVETKLALDDLLGKARRPAPVGRYVAAKGTAPEFTVTPQAVTQVPRDLKSIREFADSQGWDLVVSAEEPVALSIMDRVSGLTLAEGKSFTELMRRLANRVSRGLGEVGEQAAREGEAGFSSPEAAAGIAAGGFGALLGGLVGPSVEEWLTGDQSGIGGIAGLAFGALAGGLGAIKLASRGGVKLRGDARKALKLYKPEIDGYVPRADVAKQFGKNNLPQGQFFRLHPNDAIDHVVAGIQDISNLQNIPKVERQEKLASFLRKYTPYEIPIETGDFKRLQDEVVAAARRSGMDEEDAAMLWRGYLVNTATHYDLRPHGPKQASIYDLARDPTHPLNDVRGYDELRRIFEAAEVVSGGEFTSWAERAAATERLSKTATISEHARKLREFTRVEAAASLRQEGTPAGMLTRPAAGVRPTSSILYAAQHLRSIGDDAMADAIERYYSVLTRAETNIRETFDKQSNMLKNLFAGMHPNEKPYVRLILEGGSDGTVDRTAKEWRKYFEGHNDKLLRVADDFKQFMDDWIGPSRLDMPKQLKIEDYFPWIYSQATIRELNNLSPAARQLVGITGAYHSGLPYTKTWARMFRRARGEPAGPMIDDPLEVGLIYAYGAARKYYLDQALAQLDPKELRFIMNGQPMLGKELSQWVLDLHGVPTTVTLKMQQAANNLGLGVESMARVFGDKEWAMAVGEWVAANSQPQRIARLVRGSQFYLKIGFQITSPAVNLTQLLLNAGTDLSYGSLTKSFFTLGREKLFGPFPDPDASLLTAVRESGILSERFVHQLEWQADRWKELFKRPLESVSERRASTILGGAAMGAGAGFLLGGEETRGRATLAGALAGGVAGSYLGPVVRRALEVAKGTSTVLFDSVEALNRSVTFGAARLEYERAVRLAAAGRSGAAGDVVEGTLVGAGAGAALGSQGDEEGGALRGALIGGAVGGLGTAQGIFRGGETRAQRVLREAQTGSAGRQELRGLFADLQGRLKLDGEALTRTDVANWYAKQVTEATQFRFGKGSRGAVLRTPLGEALASLQTYTLNQMEFTGQRIAAAYRSDLKDVRIFRHVALLTGLGAMLNALAAGSDSDTSTPYWVSRIGLGFLPFARYSSQRQEWFIENPAQAFAGPFLSDLYNVVIGTIYPLISDPRARQQWDVQLDNLVDQIIGVLGNMTNMAERTASYFENLGMGYLQGAADLLRQQQATERIDRPVSTLRRGYPVPRGAGQGASEEGLGGGGLGGGGLSGGLEGGGL